MTTTDVEVPTADGTAGASLHTPAGTGPWPAVILYPDAGGPRAVFRSMGDRLAAAGFVVLVPDIYYRAGAYEPFDVATAFTDPDERQRLGALAVTMTSEVIGRDADAFARFLQDRPEVRAGAVGTTGYCLGGRISLTAAGRLGERIGAAASFHGGRLAVDDDPDSPHHLAAQVRATVYVGGAADDASFDAEQAARLHDAYVAAGVEHTIEHYAAAHGFAVADNPTFDEAADERHWSAMTSLFTTALA